MPNEVIRKSFNPLFFQASLASGGIALMAFNFLQFAIPHGRGLIAFFDIPWANLSQVQAPLYAVLIVVMLTAVITHLVLTTVFLMGLFFWLRDKKAAKLLQDPYSNVTIFPVIGSLSMSANVLWAPIGFFIPWVSAGLQSLMLPSLIFFASLLVALLLLEYQVLRVWIKRPFDTSKLNFVWLLDVFAFGLVVLTGSGIAVTSENQRIAAIAGAATFLALVMGLFLFTVKMIHLTRIHIKLRKLPDTPVLPAFFLVVPISCLFGLSLYRLASHFQTLLSVNTSGISAIAITLSYLGAVVWVIFALVLLGNYFKSQFLRSKYSAPQWGMV
jgi:hypothetical protein